MYLREGSDYDQLRTVISTKFGMHPEDKDGMLFYLISPDGWACEINRRGYAQAYPHTSGSVKHFDPGEYYRNQSVSSFVGRGIVESHVAVTTIGTAGSQSSSDSDVGDLYKNAYIQVRLSKECIGSHYIVVI